VAILSYLATPAPSDACGPPRIAPSPVIEVVATPDGRDERLRVEALVTTDRVRRVDFLLDGELIETDRRFPFGAVLAAGSMEESRAPGRLEGVAFDREGREIARDSVELDRARGSLALSLSPVSRLGDAWLEIGAEVLHPEGVPIDRVDFYRDGRYVASVGAAPYRARIPAGDEAGYLRAVAVAGDGSLAEEVRLLDERGEGEEISVGLVELYAMVTTRAGAPVTGLAADLFELRHEGRILPIERFAEGDAVPLSVALVIDGSGSMLDDMERAKRSAADFLTSTLDEGDRALLVDFDSRPRLLRAATDEISELVESFDEIRSRGGSSIYDAILFATLQLEATAGRRALVVVTDGLDSGSRISARDCAVAARRHGVPVFVLSLEEGYPAAPSHPRLELRELAIASGGGFYPVRVAADVGRTFQAIETQLRGQYLLAFASQALLSSADLAALTLDVADQRLVVRTLLGGQVRLPR
jgi:Ca-activated chloride channel family protein